MNYLSKFKEGTSLALLAGLFVAMILLVIFAPFAIIWSLNTLFVALAIPYSFWSWLAVIVLNLTWARKPLFNK